MKAAPAFVRMDRLSEAADADKTSEPVAADDAGANRAPDYSAAPHHHTAAAHNHPPAYNHPAAALGLNGVCRRNISFGGCHGNGGRFGYFWQSNDRRCCAHAKNEVFQKITSVHGIHLHDYAGDARKMIRPLAALPSPRTFTAPGLVLPGVSGNSILPCRR